MPKSLQAKQTQTDKVKELTKQLEAGVEKFFTSGEYTNYLQKMSLFHDYSFNNTILIALQKPEATLVAGFKKWEKDFNRHVKKGEKGIRIFAPSAHKVKEEQYKRDEDGNIIRNEKGEPEKEEVVITIPRFHVVTVFDVSQTDGEPLPELDIKDLNATVENYDDFVKAIEQIAPVPIQFADIPDEAKGVYNHVEKTITIQEGMSQAQTLKTLIHETTHAILHDKDKMKEAGEKPKSKYTREVEAESVAYIVCNHLGIDTSEYTFPYVATWSSSVELSELRASMETIRQASTDMIHQLGELLQDRDRPSVLEELNAKKQEAARPQAARREEAMAL